MSDDALRLRLEALNRGPLPEGNVAAAPRSTATKATPRRQDATTAPKSATFITAGLLQRGELIETEVGPHWLVRLPLEALWNGGASLVAARHSHLSLLLDTARQAIEPDLAFDPAFAPFVAALPGRAVVLDLETCGLAGSALFLIGMLRQFDGGPVVELLLARNYAEEAAVLESLWRVITGCDVVVTFNGKSFDWPMVLDRSVRHRRRADGAGRFHHLDILHHARRRWRKQLPDCRLKTLEAAVCRRSRPSDIPGHAIPGVYAHYVRTGFERDMDVVLYHNAIDLVTLFDLALRMAA